MSREPDSYDKPEPRRMSRNVPPLAWIILGLLLVVIVVAAVQRRGTHVTPQGGTMPQAGQGEAYMPPAPAAGAAPATPGAVVNDR